MGKIKTNKAPLYSFAVKSMLENCKEKSRRSKRSEKQVDAMKCLIDSVDKVRPVSYEDKNLKYKTKVKDLFV